MKISGYYLTKEQIKKQIAGFKYVRDEEKNPIGVIVWDKEDRIGWSLYNTDHEDERATTDKGILIALNGAATIDPHEDLACRIMDAARYRATKGSRLMIVLEIVLALKKRFAEEEASDLPF